MGHSHVPPASAEWADDRPTNAVEHDFGADDAVQKRLANTVALGLGREAILAEAIADQPAKQSFAATMPNGVCLIRRGSIIGSVRRPDDIEPGTEVYVPYLLSSRLLPDGQTPDPKPRPRQPFVGRYGEGLRP